MDTYASQNSTPHEDRTIASQAALCLRRFKSCLDKAAIIHARELSAVEDQLARFSLWSGNIRVFGSSRQSLDHRLREAPEVLDVVLAMLGALSQRLESYSSLLADSKPYTDASNFASIDHNLRKAHDDISGQVTLLHKLSNTIRRASKQTGNDKAAEYFVIRGEDGDDVESWLFDVFSSYLQDRFMDATEEICRRLAQSMLLRRKRILYRRARYGHAPIEVDVVPEEPKLEVPLAILSETPDVRPGSVEHSVGKHVAPRSMAPSATTLSANNFKRATAPSIVSASRTIPLNRHDALQFPSAPLWPLQSKFIQIMTSKLSSESLSEVRKRQELEKITVLSGKPNLAMPEWNEAASAVGEITCPYCFYAVPAVDMICERKWMMHVKGDLDPYVCLYEDCDSPHELYAHSRDWIKHMKGHTLRWRCTSKLHTAHTSTTQQEYIEHLRNTHSTRLSDTHLRVVADRRAVSLGPVFASCPLCGITAAQPGESSNIEEHVAGHLRQVAIKSLPIWFDDSTDETINHQSALQSLENTRTTIREGRDSSIASNLTADMVDTYSNWVAPFDPETIPHIIIDTTGIMVGKRDRGYQGQKEQNFYHKPKDSNPDLEAAVQETDAENLGAVHVFQYPDSPVYSRPFHFNDIVAIEGVSVLEPMSSKVPDTSANDESLGSDRGGISCNECGQRSDTIHNFNEHKTNCPTSTRNRECHICGKIFSSTSNLGKHKREGHENPRYGCPEQGCGKSFARRDTMIRHARKHSVRFEDSITESAQTLPSVNSLSEMAAAQSGFEPGSDETRG